MIIRINVFFLRYIGYFKCCVQQVQCFYIKGCEIYVKNLMYLFVIEVWKDDCRVVLISGGKLVEGF